MAFSERLGSRSIGWDRDGVLRGKRVFLVDGVPPVAMVDPNLPVLGSQFPGIVEPLKLDSFDGSLYNGAAPQSEVTATYTSNRSGTFGGYDPTDPELNAWRISYRSYDVSIPFLAGNPNMYSYSDVEQDPPAEVQVAGVEWSDEAHTENRTVISKEVVIGSLTPEDVSYIAQLNNTIVKIGSTFWRFVVGDVDQVATTRWKTTYSFECDNGTPDVFTSTFELVYPTAMESVIPTVTFGETFARPPFHSTVPVPGNVVRGTYPPTFSGPPFRAIPLYAVVNLSGHRQLPGWRD